MRNVWMSVVTSGFLVTFLGGSLLCQVPSKLATVVVEVTDPGGAGVPSAEVNILPPPQDGSGQLETASDGKLTLKLKPGNYNLSVSCAGFKTFSERFTVRETDEIQALSVGLHIGDTGSPPVYPDAATPSNVETFVPPSDVSFEISTVQTSLKAGESITLKCRVKNISNAVLFVPREWAATCPATPHLWASFEDGAGKHFVGGYGGDCFPKLQTFRERMSKEAVLLKPGDLLEETFLLDPKVFGLKPGGYRVEASLTGWNEEKLTDAERSELTQMGGRFMTGVVQDSIRITLTPNTK